MTELQCWPLDDKEYTSVDLGAAYAARSRGLLTAESFAAISNGDNTLTISKGVGCIHVSEFWAAFPYLLNSTILQFEDADGIYPRWDAVVLGYDKNRNTVGLYARTGLAAQSPKLPEMRRDSDFDELFLYRVTRPVGATKIEADHVVDLRMDPTYCGLMRDTIDAIDTSVMQEAFESFLAKIEKELAQINDGTALMPRAVYDPQAMNRDIFADIPYRYKATFEQDAWEGEKAPYTQTVALTPIDGGPQVKSTSQIFGTPMVERTDVYETNNRLLAALNRINNATEVSLGDGMITVALPSKPSIDVEVVWEIKGGTT